MIMDMIDYADLDIGQTRKGICPTCKQQKFYVTRKPNGYAYICFRASCPLKPDFQATLHMQDIDYRVRKPAPKGKAMERPLYMPADFDIAFFEMRFGLELDIDPGYWIKVTDDDRYAFPIWGPRDEYRGVVLRRPIWKDYGVKCPRTDRYAGSEMPKAVSYFEHNCKTKLAWYHSTDEDTVVLVEDQVSAMRISSEGVTAVAMLGTNFTQEFVLDVQKWHKTAKWHICLDPDANMKAIQIANRWRGVFPNGLRVLMLPSDPKDYQGNLLKDMGL